MKREETVVICERCGKEVTLRSSRILVFRKSAPYPKNWAKIWNKKRVCQHCHQDFKEMWQKYLSAGVVSHKIKVKN